MHRTARLVVALALVAALPLPAAAQETSPSPDLLLILDASGSMWGQIEGENKIVIARRVLKELLGELPDDAEVGLVAYGHRREGDCSDIETLAPVAPVDKEALATTIDGLNPKGKTPITASVQQAFEAVKDRPAPTSIILVSDGLETCGGDPCLAVHDAKAAGIPFVMHVVGFDVSGEDVSSLECAAQAGQGLYFSADDAGELATALERAATAPPEIPPGRLSVEAVADGELTDAAVSVTDLATGEQVAGGRTYASPETNPRLLALPRGSYRVEARAVGFKGDVTRAWEVEIDEEGGPVELVADFSSGELVLGVTRNGELSDAAVRVYPAGDSRQVSGGRTYTQARSNPLTLRLTAGTYDVELGSVEMRGDAEHRFEGVEIPPRGRVELAHDFVSGTLSVEAVRGGELVDATVNVYSAAGERAAVAGGRTYTDPRSNPKLFELSPGSYVVRARAVRLEGHPDREHRVTVVAGEKLDLVLDFGG